MRLLVFILFPLIGFSQNSHLEDFNQDGKVDSLFWEMSSGSGGGSLYFSLTDFASGRTQEVYKEYSFSTFLDVYGLPETSDYDEQAWVRMFQVMFNEKLQLYREPSFDHLLQSYYNYPARRDCGPLPEVFRVKPTWYKTPPEAPDIQIAYLQGQELELLRKTAWVGGASKSKAAIALYFGHNHTDQGAWDLEKVEMKEGHLLVGKHGIIWEKETAFSWIFTHDDPLYGGPSKLRWKSIYDVLTYNNRVIVHIRDGIHQESTVLLIDPEAGWISILFRGEVIREEDLQINLNKGQLYLQYEVFKLELDLNHQLCE